MVSVGHAGYRAERLRAYWWPGSMGLLPEQAGPVGLEWGARGADLYLPEEFFFSTFRCLRFIQPISFIGSSFIILLNLNPCCRQLLLFFLPLCAAAAVTLLPPFFFSSLFSFSHRTNFSFLFSFFFYIVFILFYFPFYLFYFSISHTYSFIFSFY